MRDTYYQSVGNPLQLDRLPPTRPETEMLSPPLVFSAQLAEVATTLLLAGVAGVCVLAIYRIPGIAWLEPYDWLFAAPICAAGVIVFSATGQLQWLLHPLWLLACTLLVVNHRTPWELQVAVISAVGSLFVYAFGRHWIAVCTATPMSRRSSQSLRAQWHGELLLLASGVGVMIGITLLTGSTLFKLALLMLPLLLVTAPTPEGLASPRWRVVFESLASWVTYRARPLPGLLQSPAGPMAHRQGFTIFAALLLAVLLVRWPESPVPRLIEVARTQHRLTSQELDARGASTFERLRYEALAWGAAFLIIASLPIVVPPALALSACIPVLLQAAAERDRAATSSSTETLLADLRCSPDPTERTSLYLGRIVADGSPVLVPRLVFQEHAHGLGDSGTGKTSLFLCPIIEQLVMHGDCSVVVLDLKADTLELLGTLQAAAEVVRRDRGIRMPLKVFSNQAGRPTFAFNPLTQPFWSKLDLLTRTDILCAANGLTYGTDYGQGFYSSSNAAVLYHSHATFPDVTTFQDLAKQIGHVIRYAATDELHPEIRKAGVHVHEVIKRLAKCRPLNVTAKTGHDRDVVEHAIDLTQVFQEPQLLYFHLSATLSPSGAPEIARLVNYMLLAAATQTKREHPVFLVIDEFQRMVASNLEYMLQLARSMGVGVILANQSMEDLKKSTTNLIPAVEANCRLRQWFSVSSSDDQHRLIDGSGLTVDRALSRSVSRDSEGRQSVSYSENEQVVSRFTINDVVLTSDHPFRSFLRIGRGAGYAQYGGLPVIIESAYHISPEEYKRRKTLPWPSGPGMFTPPQDKGEDEDGAGARVPRPKTKGPSSTMETIDDENTSSTPSDEAVAAVFDKFRESTGTETSRQRRSME